jgi:predicted phage replisome organizer
VKRLSSNNKKYYWLKLKDDFFMTREVKKLRRIAGGDTYTIIYLKLQLLSIKREGLIMYEGTESSLTEQLALELDEDEDNVKMTVAFLQANKLIEQLSEDEYLLNKVPESIGSETGAAERMRRMREKRNIVTPQLQPVTKCYTEKEIEIELEKDIELEVEVEVEQEEAPSNHFEYIKNTWNKLNEPITNIMTLNSGTNRHNMTKARIAEYGLDTIVNAIESINNSEFLKGNNDRGWIITYDWFIKPNNFLKVAEGNYIDQTSDYEKHIGRKATQTERKMMDNLSIAAKWASQDDEIEVEDE